jgi:uncharacterized protein (DUF58 family)
LVAISTNGGVIAYTFFFLCPGVVLISFLYLLYVRTHFYIYQETQTRNLTCGQPVSYRFRLQNEDVTAYTGIEVKLYSDFSSVEGLPDQKSFLLLPGEEAEFTTKLICKYRGEYDVGVKALAISDFFGLFRIQYKMPSVIRALVIPRVVTLSALKSVPVLISATELEQTDDVSQTDPVVREYREGDPLRRIHWKASARTMTLKVRQESGLRKNGVVIAFDTQRSSKEMAAFLPIENQILEIVIALLYYFANQNTHTRVIWSQSRTISRECVGAKQFEPIYKELSAVSFAKSEKIETTIAYAIQNRITEEARILFLVLSKMTPTVFLHTEKWSREGKTVVIVIVTKDDVTEYVKQSGRRRQFIAISPEEDISKVL